MNCFVENFVSTECQIDVCKQEQQLKSLQRKRACPFNNTSIQECSFGMKIQRLSSSDSSVISDDDSINSCRTSLGSSSSDYTSQNDSEDACSVDLSEVSSCNGDELQSAYPTENSPSSKNGLHLLLEALMQSTNVVQEIDHKKSAFQSCTDSERWIMMYESLEEFRRIHGHCNVPNSYECVSKSGLNIKLGTWLSTQRQLKRKGTLRPEREQRLQRLVDEGKLCWSMPSIASPDDEKWMVMFKALVKYGEEHNHCNVPYSHDAVLDDGTVVKLGAWLRKQREQKKKGGLRPDREERLLSLASINMLRLPSPNSTDDDQWQQMMDALETYGGKHGHCNVPQSHEFKTEDGKVVRLGAWLRKQRELKRKGSLKSDRLQSLQILVGQNKLQWEAPSHSPSDDDKWEAMLDALVRYGEVHGHCNLSSCQDFTTQDGTVVKLGAWLSQQRHHHKKGKLRSDREVKLQALVNEGKLSWGMRSETLRINPMCMPMGLARL